MLDLSIGAFSFIIILLFYIIYTEEKFSPDNRQKKENVFMNIWKKAEFNNMTKMMENLQNQSYSMENPF